MEKRPGAGLKTALGYGAALGIGALGVRLGLPVLLGLLGALGLDPAVRALQRRTGLGRTWAAGITVTGAVGAAGVLLWFLGRSLLREAGVLGDLLPGALETAAAGLRAVSGFLETLGEKLPGGLGDALRVRARELLTGSGAIAEGVYRRVFALATGFLGALPGMLLFGMTALLSLFFAAAELPRLRELPQLLLPEKWAGRLSRVWSCVRGALGGWLRAQMLLWGAMFLLLTAGFLLLGISSPVSLGLGVALLDALPVLGTGTVLLPWSLGAFLGGETALALGLLGLYGAAVVLRNILEPRLLGAQLGLGPLGALAALWAGWRLGGPGGMAIALLGAAVAAELVGSKWKIRNEE